ncbi:MULTISPECIES: DNA polymerase III subunit epsilon [unclassified Sphingopyxis]|uniref:DNA polymerase III subunit epsilon n=1 Tax=unclassified Sphingopyxis TaxID=2614943 RepID=UPI00285F78F4|nr:MULTISPECIES: DNA polymerase III subunit epsilon [unclassified Sphingopyxis]MDR6833313.1 DNA polymerase-3 subunit epsilon [Sphingopyxis sp. BE122]MDR7225582.1 DNA polymerase-3 subunit epsilon [Sphingopyxis sp. BE259]
MREIIFDTETTGFDPKTGDRLVEIGCIELVDRRETGVNFHAYFNPERDMPAAAEAVHGLSIQFLADKPLFAARVDELLEFLGDAPLVAHNAAFDFGFVNAELARAGRPALDMTRMCCTVQMARKLHPGAKHSLDALCTRYGIDRSHRVKHGALLDAELLAHLYIEMTGGRQIGLGLAASSPDGSTAAAAAPSPAPLRGGDRLFREPRPHMASAADLARHAEFVAGLNQPLWLDTV